jgi:hypothetical protein
LLYPLFFEFLVLSLNRFFSRRCCWRWKGECKDESPR